MITKVLIITVVLYLFFELLSHGFALYTVKILKKTVSQNDQKLPFQFIQQTIYRVILIITIILISHIYTEKIFIEQKDGLRFTWSILFLVFIIFSIWWINALIIRSILLKRSKQQSISAVLQQKLSYIMLHPQAFSNVYFDSDFLKKSKWINHILSLVAFIFLFLDIQLIFSS